MKTKIIATLGLNTCSKNVIKEMIMAGASIFRCNLSHGDISWHKEALTNAKKAGEELGIKIYTILDTQGPEIRTGIINGSFDLIKGNKLILSPARDLEEFNKIMLKKIDSKTTEIFISFSELYKSNGFKKGTVISVDSGKVLLSVEKIIDRKIYTEILNDGILTSKRHINVPGIRIDMPILMDVDEKALKMGVKLGVDFVAISFVRDKKDVEEVRAFLGKEGKKMKIISKIEHSYALKNINEIIKSSDEIMVARGDLGVEMPYYEVPLLEQMLVKKALKAKTPVIVATQMLISMTQNNIPTRAEATDIALAVQIGANKIMLSDETASGKYPIESIKVMKKIAEYTEKNGKKITCL